MIDNRPEEVPLISGAEAGHESMSEGGVLPTAVFAVWECSDRTFVNFSNENLRRKTNTDFKVALILRNFLVKCR